MKTKNIIIQATMALLIAFAVVSCNDDFFNQVPNDRITIEDVFNEKNYAERFLAGIYAYIQDESRVSYLTLDALSDDLDQSYDRPGEIAYFMYPANLGNWNASSNYYNMWLDSYRGIRSATYFMQHIEANAEMVKNGEFSRIKQYKAEARALRAYFCFCLLRQYGPFIIPEDELAPGDLPSQDPRMTRARDPYDKCVDYICQEFDAAAEDLPLHFTEQIESDRGRVTGLFCKAIKARCLLYAASPQFNGNPAYSGLANKDGSPLFSESYDSSKWEKAAKACKEIIDLGILELYKTYYRDGKTINPYLSCRDVFLDNWNKEAIFYLTTHSDNLHRHGTPRGYANGYESSGVTQQLVDEFQMANGKDISDPTSGYVETGFITEDYKDPETGWVFAPKNCWNMYNKREPRFYVSVAFNGSYAIYNNQKDKYQWKFYHGGTEGNTSHDSPRTGYVRLKHVSPSYNYKAGQQGNPPFLLIRYGEVLLNYIEALNEYDPGNPDILKYINQIRERAGLPGLESGMSQEIMRQKIRHERRVELCEEWKRYFDTRRWLIAEQTDGGPFYGMNMNGGSSLTGGGAIGFYQRVVFETRVFRKAYYLFPIPQSEIDKDPNIVQNPGW